MPMCLFMSFDSTYIHIYIYVYDQYCKQMHIYLYLCYLIALIYMSVGHERDIPLTLVYPSITMHVLHAYSLHDAARRLSE